MSKTRTEILKDIDFQFWAETNNAYGNVPLKQNMQTALKKLQKEGYFIGREFKSVDELIEHTRYCIQQLLLAKPLQRTNDRFIQIFDLIQVWGGWGGVKGFYTKPKDYPIRKNTDKWIGVYKKAAVAAKDNPEHALELFKTMPQIGESSASRHLLFWGNHPPSSDLLKKILFRHPDKGGYKEFLYQLDTLAKCWNVDILLVERALFGFTEFYEDDLKRLDVDKFRSCEKDFVIIEKLLNDMKRS